MGGRSFTVVALGADWLDAIEALSHRAFDPRYGEAWSKAQCLSVLALPGYRIVGVIAEECNLPQMLLGFAIIRTIADESELLLLAVDPEKRRQGVASTLLMEWLNNCRSNAVARAFLEMRTDNDARSLYHRHGFSVIGVRQRYYRGSDGRLRDAVTMENRLDSSSTAIV